MSDGRAELFRALRTSTAALLKYDIDNLTAAQEIRVARAAALRLQLDDLQSRQLAGEQINMSLFVAASEALERMVGGQPDQPATFDADRVVADLERSIQGILDVRQLKADPVGGEAQRDSDAPHSSSSPAPAGGGLPAAVEPAPIPVLVIANTQPAQPRQSPPRVETDLEKMARVNAVPANPAPGPREAWRDYVGPDGIVAPWFRPHG
jgi:hypothetical protein